MSLGQYPGDQVYIKIVQEMENEGIPLDSIKPHMLQARLEKARQASCPTGIEGLSSAALVGAGGAVDGVGAAADEEGSDRTNGGGAKWGDINLEKATWSSSLEDVLTAEELAPGGPYICGDEEVTRRRPYTDSLPDAVPASERARMMPKKHRPKGRNDPRAAQEQQRSSKVDYDKLKALFGDVGR